MSPDVVEFVASFALGAVLAVSGGFVRALVENRKPGTLRPAVSLGGHLYVAWRRRPRPGYGWPRNMQGRALADSGRVA